MEGQENINWGDFETGKGSDAFLKRKAGIKYTVTFKKDSLRQIETRFSETKTVDGKQVVTEKIGTALRLDLDTLDGQPISKAMDVTAKKEAQTVKGYLDEGMLYTQKFAITPHGEGKDRTYSWMNLGPK